MIRSVNETYRNRSQWLIIFPADPRFSNIQTDPRFRLPSKKATHVQIDQRFAHMLRDEEFSTRAKVDRYGRKLSKDAGKRELEKFYRIGDENIEGEDTEADDADDDEEIELELRRANVRDAKIASPSSESSEESSSDEDDSEDQEEVFKFPDEHGEDGEGVPMGEPSRRLAVVNLDWDNIRAVDLMAVFSSFTPGNGRISKISVYPSEFGKERMAREEMEGPPKEIFSQRNPETRDDDSTIASESDEDELGDWEHDEEIKKSLIREDEGKEFDSAKLRRYQLERLRYYYAVITCSSTPVAEAIYEAVDGTEYLTTANFFDLRFVPDELDFSDDKARDECDDIPDGYRPNEFVTDALQHSKVKLTWDADDRSRKEAQKRAFTGSRANIDENDLKAYLGSDSSEDEAPEPVIIDATTTESVAEHDADEPKPKLSRKEAERQRMRALLGLPTEPVVSKKAKAGSTPVGDVQVTFSSAFTSEPEKGSVFKNEPPHEETTVEKYIRKEKERKKNRKEKMVDSREANSNIDPTELEKTSADAEDLGFDDPFFENPSSKASTKSKSKKSPKLAKDAQNSTPLAELELLMIPEKSANKDAIKHFDMQEIALAEKALRKAKKSKGKSKMSKREKSALEAMTREGGDGFEVDVQDPRFGAVFERSEFAIDPSHPKFKGTEGMKKILEEGRKKRQREEVGELDGEGDVRKKNKADEIAGRKAGRRNEVDELVARVKRKAVK